MSNKAMQLDLTVDFGEDTGNDFGSLFEARDSVGRVVCGAGFAGVYNTVFRNDRLALQFFIRQPIGDNVFSTAVLPPSTTDSGSYIFNYGGKLHAKSASGDQSGTKPSNIGHNPRDADVSRRVSVWDEKSRQWHNDDDLDWPNMLKGDAKMRVAGKMLKFVNSTVTYDGQVILSPPAEGFYHHYYYALGNLVCFHKIDTNIHLVAFAWKPGQVIDVNDAVKIKTGTGREFPFAIGHFNDEILVSTNQGWSYCYNGKQWRIAQSWDKSGSYQLYSTIHWQDKLLLAHYPSGYLWDYDGAGGKKIANWPPGLEGVSHQSREAQTTMIYGGDLYVGVWPWAEVWRYDADEDQWHFITRLISHPESSDQFIHPYDAEVDEHNATHEMQYQCNAWGQRCSGMSAVGESLMISKSAKWTWPADMQPEFMTNEQRLEHAQITKLTVPGNLTVPLKWTGKAIHLSLFITSDSMTIEQDGQLIAELPITADMADRVRDAEVKLGQGIFGPFAGESVDILK